MSTQHTPGPWATAHVAEDTSLVSAGWYVFRVNNGRREWLSSSGSSSRFETEAQALAAIAKATGSAA